MGWGYRVARHYARSFQTPKPYRVTQREKLPDGRTLSRTARITENQARKLRGEVGEWWYLGPACVLIAIGIAGDGTTIAGRVVLSVVLFAIFFGWCRLVDRVHRRYSRRH
jgi:hypothetical protein